jgi:homocysteine S-methyltransferase
VVVTCFAPADVLPAVEIARTVTGKPVIVYPNSGEEWDGQRRVWIGAGRWSPDLAPQWVAAGARIVGGCCRVMPDDIAALAATVALP